MTMHGMRGTFRSWTQDTKTGFDKETIEHCMHHITGDAAEVAYKHGEALEKRRELMQMFADHCHSEMIGTRWGCSAPPKSEPRLAG